MGKYGTKNKVKIDPFNYSLTMLGESKIGKTTLLYEVAEKLVGDEGYIFAEFYREKGAECIEGIVRENIPDWDSWVEMVDDIVENKTTDYPKLRVIFVDTYDQYIDLAVQAAINLWNRKKPQKKGDTLNSTWGFDGGKKVIELMFEQIDRLDNVGVKVWFIGHCKTKEVKNVYDDEPYLILTSDQQQNYFNALKKNTHFLCLAYYDRTIQKQKTGRKNIVTKKDEIKSVVTGEARKIMFRDEGYAVDSGGRFADIVPEIDFDVDEFIKAITDAIKAEIEKKGKSIEERRKENKQEEKEQEKRVAEAEKQAKAQAELDKVLDEIKEFVVANKSNLDVLKPIIAKSKELGYSNPTLITDVEDAKAILAMTLK